MQASFQFDQNVFLMGIQWGDEGKGKVCDAIAENFDYIVRFQGGNNAGHTIYRDGKKIVLHNIPSGALYSKITNIMGHGMVLNIQSLIDELNDLKNHQFEMTPERLLISPHINVITSFHLLLDKAREEKASNKIGTTLRGIGPCYEDRVARIGIKLSDFKSKDHLRAKLVAQASEKIHLLKDFYHMVDVPTPDQELERLYSLFEKIEPFVKDPHPTLMNAIARNERILFEGAQGALLDIDLGSYPYVTSSNTGLGAIQTGLGLLPRDQEIQKMGVFKAYLTRVGEGPFPTESLSHECELIQKNGHEFGASTGRKRRVGWLDLVLLKSVCDQNNIDYLTMTKADVIFDTNEVEDILFCKAYRSKDAHHEIEIRHISPGLDLSLFEPIYDKIPNPREDFQEFKRSGLIGEKMKNYFSIIEEVTQRPIRFFSYGPEPHQMIDLTTYQEQ